MFAVAEADNVEEGLNVFEGGEGDGLVVLMARDGHGYALMLTDKGLDSDVPLLLRLAAEIDEERGRIS